MAVLTRRGPNTSATTNQNPNQNLNAQGAATEPYSERAIDVPEQAQSQESEFQNSSGTTQNMLNNAQTSRNGRTFINANGINPFTRTSTFFFLFYFVN